MSDKMKRRTLIVCAGVLVLCGLPMVVMAVVQRDARMGLYGVMSLLFALSDVLQLFLVGGCWAAPSGHDVRFEDARIIRSGMRFCESRASMATSKPFNRS